MSASLMKSSGTDLPRLVVTDLDGTLLRSDRTVSASTRAVLDRLRADGVAIAPATARQTFSLRRGIAEDAGFAEWAILSNGALVIHLGTGQILLEQTLASAAQRAVIAVMSEAVPGVEFATVAEAGQRFRVSQGYRPLATFGDHQRSPESLQGVDLDELTAVPVLKLVVRHRSVSPPELAPCLAGVADIEVTWSGASFLEISAAGVTKGTGLRVLADHLGLERDQIVAFGDARNDLPLFSAAGHGVAMPHSEEVVRQAATEVAEWDHDQDGVARHLCALAGWEWVDEGE